MASPAASLSEQQPCTAVRAQANYMQSPVVLQHVAIQRVAALET